jgi:two-component system LytT family response regulator
MMKVVVIEDQVQLRRNLIHQIHQTNLGFEVIGEAASVSEGIKVILKTKPDIVFFDIEIIEGSSFEILDLLPEINFKSVFATAHDHFAVKAIKYSAFDFLVKPFQTNELEDTLKKLRADINKKDDYQAKFELLFNELKGKINNKIAISSTDSVKYIEVNKIVRLEADGSYCSIFLDSGEIIVASKNMGFFEQLLPEKEFIKVHRSHVINLHFVDAIIKNDGGFIKLTSGAEIPISRRKKDEFLRLIEIKMMGE